MQYRRLPSYLRTHRRTWTLTQKELAFLAGLASGAVSKHERNRHIPKLNAIIAYELIFEWCIRALMPVLSDQIERTIVERAQQLLKKYAVQNETPRIRRVRQLLRRIVARSVLDLGSARI